MNFSIIIPTYNNFKYLKLTINSILKNSKFNHEIIVHNNANDKKTLKFLIGKKIKYTTSNRNIGLCTSVNLAAKKSTKEYLCYSHDDMYFLPGWDIYLKKEIDKISHNRFYLSCTQIEPREYKGGKINNHIFFNAGKFVENFNEKKLLLNFKKLKFHNLQGSHWAPHIFHKNLWKRVGGFSEEFNPGFVSDPDLNCKLWHFCNVRIFKGVNNSRVYHFGSQTTRKRKIIKKNNGRNIFLKKWKFTVEHFVKYYLQRGKKYNGPLKIIKNPSYYLSLFSSKLKSIILMAHE